MRDVTGGGYEVEIFLFKLVALCVEFGKALRLDSRLGRFVRQDDGFGFDLQPAVLRKNIKLVYPIAIGVAIGHTARARRGSEAKRETTLFFVVKRPETDLVVAFGNGTVVMKFSCVNESESVHATTA